MAMQMVAVRAVPNREVSLGTFSYPVKQRECSLCHSLRFALVYADGVLQRCLFAIIGLHSTLV
jgi:hypothetical protein